MSTVLATIICCYNDPDQYCQFRKSIEGQSVPASVIGMDNTDSRYKSCAEAYNRATDLVSTEYVIYAHQDIRFRSENDLERFVGYLTSISKGDVLGVAGTRFNEKHVLSEVLVSDRLVRAGGSHVSGKEACDVLDECFFGGLAEDFKSDLAFDEELCNNWHLYAVDTCLKTKLSGHGVYVCDVALQHLSNGNQTPVFFHGFYRLCRKYKNSYSYIKTSCISARTALPGRLFMLAEKCAAYYIRRIVSRFRILHRRS